MRDDTDLGGPGSAFPPTRDSVVRAAAGDNPAVRQRARDSLIAAYWKPIYKYLRLRWHCDNEDAKDLTQAFFAQALTNGFFEKFDPARARFRTYVRLCVDGLVSKERRAEGRLKRGGGVAVLSLDFDEADGELRSHEPAKRDDPDELFRQEWLRGLFGLAVDDLRQVCAASGKAVQFSLFQRYDMNDSESEAPTYAQLAEEFGVPVTQVTNFLAAARRQFRRLLLDRLRAATGSEEEYHQEVQRLFGGAP
jgi:RNA polymerase sigma factor (sigma-70 family)